MFLVPCGDQSYGKPAQSVPLLSLTTLFMYHLTRDTPRYLTSSFPVVVTGGLWIELAVWIVMHLRTKWEELQAVGCLVVL